MPGFAAAAESRVLEVGANSRSGSRARLPEARIDAGVKRRSLNLHDRAARRACKSPAETGGRTQSEPLQKLALQCPETLFDPHLLLQAGLLAGGPDPLARRRDPVARAGGARRTNVTTERKYHDQPNQPGHRTVGAGWRRRNARPAIRFAPAFASAALRMAQDF
jgi:hypothetical protein